MDKEKRKRNYFTPMKYYRDKKNFVQRFLERNKSATTRTIDTRAEVTSNTPAFMEMLQGNIIPIENTTDENSDVDIYSTDGSGSIIVASSEKESRLTDDIKYSSVYNNIRQWALIFNVNHNALTALLAILREQLKQSLPKDSLC